MDGETISQKGMIFIINYYIGIDGGGTNCRLIAVDEQLNQILAIDGGSTNTASNTLVSVSETFNRLFSLLFSQHGLTKEGCLGLCIGNSGLDNEASFKKINNIIDKVGFSCPITIVNDGVIALASATRGNPGVIIISGTGSIAYGLDTDGNIIRCGGWGPMFDAIGSGYWIGKEALKHAFYAYDGRGPDTVLTQVIKEAFYITDLPDCLEQLYGEKALNKADIAKIAIEVEQGAQVYGDAVCMQILNEAADGLVKMANAVLKRTGTLSKHITVSGGCILNNAYLFDVFTRKINEIYPTAYINKLEHEPVWGAIYLAVQSNTYVESVGEETEI